MSKNIRNLIISSTAGRFANCNQKDREKKEPKCEMDLTVALATSNSQTMVEHDHEIKKRSGAVKKIYNQPCLFPLTTP